jgi:hypothetical protein
MHAKSSPSLWHRKPPKFSYHTSFIKEGVIVYLRMRELSVSQLLEQPPFLVGSQDDLSFGGKETSPSSEPDRS